MSEVLQPPLTEAEKREKLSLAAEIHAIADRLKQRNLNNAVKLAMEAAQGRGELVAHFAELGRRFGSSTDNIARRKKTDRFSVIPGGVA